MRQHPYFISKPLIPDGIIKDSVTLKCHLIGETEAAMDFIKKHINKVSLFTPENQPVEPWDYTLEAVREIIVNVIFHRAYREASDSVLKILDDRIIVFNPGRLPEGKP